MLAESTSTVDRGSAPIGALQREALILNLDASLKVHARHQFFSWTQGLLQNLVRHELLICAVRGGKSAQFHVESFSMGLEDPSRVSDLFRQDSTLVPRLVKAWEENRLHPVVATLASLGEAENGGALAKELQRLGAASLAAHGTYDSFGKLASFFVFACQPDAVAPSQAHVVELVVPFLNAAWLRTQFEQTVHSAEGARPASGGILTVRETEILKWIYLGKSNIEIGAILSLSPLTVKNHVQKILRKLNVRNRTQAVGKGLALRVLNP